MEIFHGDGGIELTPDEFYRIVEMGLLEDLKQTVKEMGGNLLVTADESMTDDELDEVIEDIVDKLLDEPPEDDELENIEGPTYEDLRVVDMLRRLGYL